MGTHSAKETDFYTEVASIGGGHAATALSDMLQSRVRMGVPEASEMPLANMSTIIAPEATRPQLVKIDVVGELDGALCVIFEEPRHYEEVLGCTGEMLQSAFSEISNILCARFLIAINQILEINTEVSPPQGTTLDRDDLVTELKELAENADPFFTLRAGLTMEGIDSNASILYFPTQTGLDQLKKSL